MQQAEALSEVEWDFRELVHRNPTIQQRQELHAAIRYEYARESESIRKLADEFADLQEHQLEERGSLVFPKPAKLFFFTALPFWNCIFWPRFFPRIPWLRIPEGDRALRVANYVTATPPRPYLEINESDDLKPWESPKKGGRAFIGTGENLIVWIDWALANNAEIVASFGDWVRKSRPSVLPEPRGDTSRQNVTAAYLTRLAVMRLVHRYPFWHARELGLDHRLSIPPRQSNALKMRRQVAADLRRMFLADVFENTGEPLMPLGELPRSWSTVTEKRRQSRNR